MMPNSHLQFTHMLDLILAVGSLKAPLPLDYFYFNRYKTL